MLPTGSEGQWPRGRAGPAMSPPPARPSPSEPGNGSAAGFLLLFERKSKGQFYQGNTVTVTPSCGTDATWSHGHHHVVVGPA